MHASRDRGSAFCPLFYSPPTPCLLPTPIPLLTWGHARGLQVEKPGLSVGTSQPVFGTEHGLPAYSCVWEHIILEEFFLQGGRKRLPRGTDQRPRGHWHALGGAPVWSSRESQNLSRVREQVPPKVMRGAVLGQGHSSLKAPERGWVLAYWAPILTLTLGNRKATGSREVWRSRRHRANSTSRTSHSVLGRSAKP